MLTVCGSDGHQQRLSPYTVSLAAAAVTRRKLGRLWLSSRYLNKNFRPELHKLRHILVLEFAA